MSRVLQAVQEELAELRAQVARLERIEAELTGEAVPPGPRKLLPRPRKAGKREGEQRRPPSQGKSGGLRALVAAHLKEHPDDGPKEIAKALGKGVSTVWYHFNALRKKSA